MKLRTKLSVADCKARLGAATDVGGLALSWDAGKQGAVVGEFRGSAFRLHTRKYYSNSFAPFFYGRLSEAEGGTSLEGVFLMNPFVRLLVLFWFSFLVLFSAGMLIVPAQAHPVGGVGRGSLFAGVAVLAVLGFALIQLGKWLGRGEREVIHSFLKGTLEADNP